MILPLALASFLTVAGYRPVDPPVSTWPAAQKAATPAQVGKDAVNFQQTCNLQDALIFLHEKHGVSYVCDILPGDRNWKYPLDIKNKSMTETIAYLSAVFSRSMTNVNGIFVFRGRRWFDAGYNVSESLLSEPALQIERGRRDMDGKPARLVKVSITNTPSGKAVSELSRVSLWPITISGELERRKISLQSDFVSPAALGEAISTLFNAQTAIAIKKTLADREAEKQNDDSHLTERERMCLKLRSEFDSFLSDEQKQKSLSEEVAIKISDLPATLRSKAIDYITYLANRPGQIVGIDMARIAEFEIVFLPPGQAPRGALGVNGRATDGLPIDF